MRVCTFSICCLSHIVHTQYIITKYTHANYGNAACVSARAEHSANNNDLSIYSTRLVPSVCVLISAVNFRVNLANFDGQNRVVLCTNKLRSKSLKDFDLKCGEIVLLFNCAVIDSFALVKMTSVQTNDVFETSLSAHGSDKSIFNLLYSIGKKAVIAKTIYFVGYMHWSVAWLVTAIVLIETREYLLKSSEFKREITKASAETTEKHAILSRLSDLPSWVNFYR